MAKTDRDLFERLRSVGLRKQAARTLSGIGEGAGKKAIRAARGAVEELRALADEIERRLPAEAGRRGAAAPAASTRSAGAGAASAARRAGAGRVGGSGRRGGGPRGGAVDGRSTASSPRAGATARAVGSAGAGRRSSPAPRGHNKAKILQALAAGPKTAAEVARETGIATGTVSTTLNKLARSGEVAKAPRGYALPAGGPGASSAS